MLEFLQRHFDSVIIFLILFQGFMFNRLHARTVRQKIDVERELWDTWGALIECSKVLAGREDFDSRHVHKLIYDLARKHQPAGFRLHLRNEEATTETKD